jgi:hypothetical protein
MKYRYIANRVHPTPELTDEELKTRSDPNWVEEAYSSYEDTVTVSQHRLGMIISDQTDLQLVPYAYFLRKMQSLGYPQETYETDDTEDDTSEEVLPGFLINTNILLKKKKNRLPRDDT